ncbi:MYCBP-associated protein-like isoform X2 [Clytia hemisphaerica]|uniref:MYCBP-associated protein-like isoform X2 n=1 Tax=Clytia hemisphaerica TaxID=252671 RepID=UPI0034D66805
MMNNNNKLANKNSKDRTRSPTTPKATAITTYCAVSLDKRGKKGKSVENTAGDVSDELENIESCVNVRGENDELKINQTYLQSNHSPQPPKDRPKESILIRRPLPSSKYKQSKPKEKVFIAKQVQSEESLDISELINSEPLDTAEVKPFNILGSFNDFKQQAARERQIQLLSAKSSFNATANKKDNKEKTFKTTDDSKNINQSNALRHWEKQMASRRKQQQHLAKKMGTSQEALIMNQSDSYRSVQEERTLIDRSMPLKDYGKGYRVGSEFWKQAEEIGGNQGVSVTLSETEKGNVPSIEHVGHPANIKSEMGNTWSATHRMKNVHFNWWNSSYLNERREYLKDVMDELDPHKPYMDGLEVIGHGLQLPQNVRMNQGDALACFGNNEHLDEDVIDDEEVVDGDFQDDCDVRNIEGERRDPLSCYDDVIPEPIFGPSLLINGQPASWEGSPVEDCNSQVGVETRLSFEANIGELGESVIALTNDGTTVLKFSWKKLPKYDPFGLKKGKPLERFYFDIRDGIILPGQTISIPAVFKSSNAGIFTEQWCLETHPTLCAGRRLLVTLHGVATQLTNMDEHRRILEEEYVRRQNIQMAARIVQEMVRGVSTPPRSPSPPPLLTEEEEFNERNLNLHYNKSAAEDMKKFFVELNPRENWDLSIMTMLKNIENLEEADVINDGEEEKDVEETKEEALNRLNKELVSFNHPVRKPAHRNTYDKCYKVICEAVDRFVLQTMTSRHQLGMPEKEIYVKQEIPVHRGKSRKVVDTQKNTRNDAKSPNKKKEDAGKARTPNAKEKKQAEPLLIAKEESAVIQETKDNTNTAAFVVNETQHANYNKYMDKMYSQVYSCLQDLADDIEAIFALQE